MTEIVSNTSYQIYYETDIFEIYVSKHTLANKVNKILNYYKDCRIKKGEEAKFIINAKYINDVCEQLGHDEKQRSTLILACQKHLVTPIESV